jgi:hypothetical protein
MKASVCIEKREELLLQFAKKGPSEQKRLQALEESAKKAKREYDRLSPEISSLTKWLMRSEEIHRSGDLRGVPVTDVKVATSLENPRSSDATIYRYDSVCQKSLARLETQTFEKWRDGYSGISTLKSVVSQLPVVARQAQEIVDASLMDGRPVNEVFARVDLLTQHFQSNAQKQFEDQRNRDDKRVESARNFGAKLAEVKAMDLRGSSGSKDSGQWYEWS